ncbi:MAG: restriction endonuclease subunit S [Saprospiraceae bacterium]|nr:restriction endonuclease subunit S [Saprospiraceae bacterium]
MSKKTNTKTLPVLRFKQYDGNSFPNWIEVKLSSLANLITTKNRNSSVNRVLTNSATYGILDQRDYFEKDIANSSNLDGYYIVDQGDYVYNPRTSNVAPVGPISKNKIGIGVMSPLYTIFRFKIENNDFFEQYFKTSCWYSYLRFVSNSGARYDRMSITPSVFMNMPVPFPDLVEQQKIADCLSSLDDLITAESQKLDELKVHKKGLMQQLFPAEGETVPKLRFAEFRDSGEWEEEILKNACRMQAGKFVSASEINDIKSDELFPCYGGNGLRGYTKSFTHTGRYSLIGRQGALCGNVSLVDGQFHATEHAVVVSPYDKIDTIWLFYMLTYLNLNQYATGQAQPGLSVDNLEKVEINIPKDIKEQQRIGECLSTLDETIMVETDKIEALKDHKKGLMQGLFPNSDMTVNTNVRSNA